jgi:hypothetical protein
LITCKEVADNRKVDGGEAIVLGNISARPRSHRPIPPPSLRLISLVSFAEKKIQTNLRIVAIEVVGHLEVHRNEGSCAIVEPQ